MFENTTQRPQRVLLAAVDTGEYDVEASLDELAELTQTAGGEVVGRISQKRASFEPATCMGSGRLEEMREFAHNFEVELIIFDHELTAAQLKNIEAACDCAVIDRTMLILDIFAARANTSEGRLQVELAQQRYRLPRLMGLGTSLSRLGGGIGTRGPGETKLESDRRHIRGRIQALEEKLQEMESRRERMRQRRKKDGVSTVAIVGYTNVGKSTLLNHLTQAGVLAEDKLFATLDPTARALLLPDGRSVMLIDTVGLVRRLPHHLVEAFKSTLEEAVAADLILNVCDISSPDAQTQVAVTRDLLAQLGVTDTPVITVLNKADLLAQLPLGFGRDTVAISAKTGHGVSKLLEVIAETLPPGRMRARLLVPYSEGGVENRIARNGQILEREYRADGLYLDALVDHRDVAQVEQYFI